MTILWDSNKVDEVIGGLSSEPWTCSGISIDSRTIEKGDLFVALIGENGDGHAFLQDAASQEAGAALVSEEVHVQLPTVQVLDTLKAMEKLGIAARERSNAFRIAVTGSVGKTSTKDALKTVFKDQGVTHGSLSSYNNHWGVPLTLARMPHDTQFAIFEVGMNHPEEIRPLTHMIKPHMSIITSVVEAHAEFFKSVEDIARAKAEIFDGMSEGGLVLLNQDNPYFEFLSTLAHEHALKVYGFGQAEKADFRLLSWESTADTSKVIAEIGGETFSYVLPLPGMHWILNSLAVLGAVYLAGANVAKAITSLAHIEVPQGRGQRYPGPFTVIDESYNANPTSMRSALFVLGKNDKGRKIAVLGDMREMGTRARVHHEELLEPLLENRIDMVFCCGPLMAHLYERLPSPMRGGYAPTSLELIPLVLNALKPGDVISVKASLGTRIKPVVEALLERQKKMAEY